MESSNGTRVPTLLKIGSCSAFERNEYIPTYKVGKHVPLLRGTLILPLYTHKAILSTAPQLNYDIFMLRL